MKLTRRGLFGLAAGASGIGLVRTQLAHADHKLATGKLPQYDEAQVATICQQCPGGCGLIARVIDGEVVGIAGNPNHPVNRGAVCAKAFGALQLLNAPDRVKGPLVRDGDRGKFRPASWDEALQLVAGRLADLRTKGLAHTVAILGGQYRGTRDALWRQFAAAYGTPNYIRLRCLEPEKPAAAHRLMHGATTPFAPDLGEAQIIVSFGAGLLESWVNPVHASRAFAKLRRSDDRRRGKLIQIDPRRSPTAIKADRWVSLVPGTDGILALGLANVLVREGMYDASFVEENCDGFEQFKALVLRDYGLMAVSSATGVPVKTILDVARDLGTTRPAVVIGERGPSYGPDDLRTRMAIHALNALTGAIGKRGGMIPQAELPLTAMPAVPKPSQPPIATDAEALQTLPSRLLAATPYPVNALFLFATNPLANHPGKEELAKAIEKVPLVVSFSPFMDESAKRADVILPDSLPLERWQDDGVAHLAGVTAYSVGRPACAPRHSTRNTADVVLRLASLLKAGEALPWKSYDEALRAASRGLFEARRGYVVTTAPDESLRQTMERQGYWLPEFASFDAFFDALAKRGAWSDATSLPPGRKAIGRFDFKPLLQQPAAAPQPLATDFPLRLNTYRLATRPMGGAQGQPWLLEQPASHLQATWSSWIELHPKTAETLGIHDGDQVLVESRKGTMRLAARLYAGTREEVVSVPLFGGPGANVNDLIAGDNGFGGATRVRIRRA